MADDPVRPRLAALNHLTHGPHRHGIPHLDEQRRQMDRLREERKGTRLRRLDGLLDRSVCGHDDHGQGGIALSARPKELDPIHPVYPEIRHEDRDVLALERGEDRLGMREHADGVAFPLKVLGERLGARRVIIDDEDGRCGGRLCHAEVHRPRRPRHRSRKVAGEDLE